MNPHQRIESIELLAPKMRLLVRDLAKDLTIAYETGKTQTHFKIFETFRHPLRQSHLFTKRTTKAGPFESAHQFGLAVDFVPWNDDPDIGPIGWNWDAANEYSFLATRAKEAGLTTPIQWDPCHVEHPKFSELRELWKRNFK